MHKVGEIKKEIIDLLNLDITPGVPIYIGKNNIQHIQNDHPYEYEKYYEYLPDIIASPDYIGINPKDKSIQYIKQFIINKEYIRVAVKVSRGNKYYVRTLHLLSTNNAQRYIEKGTLKRLDNN